MFQVEHVLVIEIYAQRAYRITDSEAIQMPCNTISKP